MHSNADAAAIKQRRVPHSVRDGRGGSVHAGVRGRPAVDALHAAAPPAPHPRQHRAARLLPHHLHLRRHLLLLHAPHGGRHRRRLHRPRRSSLLHLHRMEQQAPMAAHSVQSVQPRLLQNIPMPTRRLQGFMIFTI